jgi:hypothetical protein
VTEQHREISILASMAKGGAVEMDPADDARKLMSPPKKKR